MLKKYLTVFFISMVPLIELRGAIPVARGLHLPLLTSYGIAVIGNMLPVPIIYLFAEKVLDFGSRLNGPFGSFCRFCVTKGRKAGEKLSKSAGNKGLFLALMLFVGIPLPGTGAWTGTLAASFLKMDFKTSVLAAMCGVMLAGVIMLVASHLGFNMIGM